MSTVFGEKSKLFFIFLHPSVANRGISCYTVNNMELFPIQSYKNKKICVAVSGGADSVCLLHFFYTRAEKYRIVLSAVTCEHGIRGESSLKDLAFVEELCRQWEIPLRVFRADVPGMAKTAGIGLEEAGRNFRYSCFNAVLKGADGVDFVATAHHKGDLIETVLFRLIRGTSLGGLDVFPERQGIIRPLSAVTRAQILDYVNENSLPYVTDESNTDEKYTRNFLRHTVLPSLEKAVSGAGEHLAEFAERAVRDDGYLQELAQRKIKHRTSGESSVPAELPLPLFTRACVQIFKEYGIVKDYTGANLQDVAELKCLQSGKRICLPNGLAAAREYEEIVFYRPDNPLQQPFAGELPFSVGSFSLNGHGLIVAEEIDGEALHERYAPDPQCAPTDTARALAVDLDAFPAGCVIRTRREGDAITPFGGGRKTLKKFLTDKKISARRGRLLPLVAKGSEIYAVCGVEIADRVKITAQTTRKGYIYFS